MEAGSTMRPKITQKELAEIAGVEIWCIRRDVHLLRKMLGLTDTTWAIER